MILISTLWFQNCCQSKCLRELTPEEFSGFLLYECFPGILGLNHNGCRNFIVQSIVNNYNTGIQLDQLQWIHKNVLIPTLFYSPTPISKQDSHNDNGKIVVTEMYYMWKPTPRINAWIWQFQYVFFLTSHSRLQKQFLDSCSH